MQKLKFKAPKKVVYASAATLALMGVGGGTALVHSLQNPVSVHADDGLLKYTHHYTTRVGDHKQTFTFNIQDPQPGTNYTFKLPQVKGYVAVNGDYEKYTGVVSIQYIAHGEAKMLGNWFYMTNAEYEEFWGDEESSSSSSSKPDDNSSSSSSSSSSKPDDNSTSSSSSKPDDHSSSSSSSSQSSSSKPDDNSTSSSSSSQSSSSSTPNNNSGSSSQSSSSVAPTPTPTPDPGTNSTDTTNTDNGALVTNDTSSTPAPVNNGGNTTGTTTGNQTAPTTGPVTTTQVPQNTAPSSKPSSKMEILPQTGEEKQQVGIIAGIVGLIVAAAGVIGVSLRKRHN